jgi:hypothetical protein
MGIVYGPTNKEQELAIRTLFLMDVRLKLPETVELLKSDTQTKFEPQMYLYYPVGMSDQRGNSTLIFPYRLKETYKATIEWE